MTLWQVVALAALWFTCGFVWGFVKWGGGNHCRHRKLEAVSEYEVKRAAPFHVRCKTCGQFLNGYVDDDVIASQEHPS